MRRRRFDLPDGTVAALEFGEASAPLHAVFLHANGFNALTYRGALAAAAEAGAGRILAPDLRGHGHTGLPVPAEHPGWGIYAGDLLALLSALGETPRVLAGHSMGATACLLASGLTDAKPRLLLFEPVIVPRELYTGAPAWDFPWAVGALKRRLAFPSRDAAFEAYKGRGAFRTWPDQALSDYLEDGLRDAGDGGVALACPPEWEASNYAHFSMDDPWDALGGAHVTILRGEEASTCAAQMGEVVPGTTHFLPMERPNLVARQLAAS